jgi:hypothetical protein
VRRLATLQTLCLLIKNDTPKASNYAKLAFIKFRLDLIVGFLAPEMSRACLKICITLIDYYDNYDLIRYIYDFIHPWKTKGARSVYLC